MKSKIMLVLALFAVGSHAAMTPIEKFLDDKLEEFRVIMRTGNPEKKIPVMAPYENKFIKVVGYNFENMTTANGEIKNLKVDNLDGFVNNKMTFNVITLRSKFDITYPNVTAQGFEDLFGSIFMLLPYWGYGKFYMNPINFRMWGEAKFALTRDGYLNLKSFDAECSLDKINSNFDNLLTGGDLSDLLNRVIPDVIVSAIKNFPEAVSETLNIIMVPILDKFFSYINIADFPKD